MSDNFIQENSDIITLRAMANVFMPEALDPVGQEDDDVDNDGDSDKSDEYLKKRRKAVGSAIDKRKKKLKEAAAAHTSDDDDKEITEKKVKNKVVINPEMKESKDYDPMEDDEFDHDEAEENRGVSGKNNPKGGKSLYKKKKLKKEEVEQIEEKSVQMQRRVDRYLGRDKAKAKERLNRQNERREKKAALAAMEKQYKGMKSGIYSSYEPEGEQLDENPLQWLRDKLTKKNNQSGDPTPPLKGGAGALPSYARRSNAASGDAFARRVDALQNNSYEPEGEQLNERPYQVMGYDKEGGKEKKVGKPVKSRKYADARAAELADTHKKTGGKYRSQYVEAAEDRAKDEHLMRGGMAARKDYDRPPAKKLSNKELGIKPGKTWVQKQMEKKKSK